MREENRAAKRAMIAEAAYRIIEQKGFAGTSMLAIAKAAKASNETLYNWYGDKLGLFRALVEANAAEAAEALASGQAQPDDPLGALETLGAALLYMVLGERAIALNRAAAGDASGSLGAALAKGGRETIAPMLVALLGQAAREGRLAGEPGDMAEVFVALLIGDSQIRRVTGVIEAPDRATCDARAAQAVARLMRLFPGRR